MQLHPHIFAEHVCRALDTENTFGNAYIYIVHMKRDVSTLFVVIHDKVMRFADCMTSQAVAAVSGIV